jgi:hypothetical protein
MSVEIQVSQVINRPVSEVFHFYADEHVRNHPRWDPDMQLSQVSAGPIGAGTMIHRRNNRSGTPVEGTMEVVEFERNRAFGTIIHDGPVEIRGRADFEPLGDNQTRLTIFVELPGMDESMDKSFLTSRMERSIQNIKQLIESQA